MDTEMTPLLTPDSRRHSLTQMPAIKYWYLFLYLGLPLIAYVGLQFSLLWIPDLVRGVAEGLETHSSSSSVSSSFAIQLGTFFLYELDDVLLERLWRIPARVLDTSVLSLVRQHESLTDAERESIRKSESMDAVVRGIRRIVSTAFVLVGVVRNLGFSSWVSWPAGWLAPLAIWLLHEATIGNVRELETRKRAKCRAMYVSFLLFFDEGLLHSWQLHLNLTCPTICRKTAPMVSPTHAPVRPRLHTTNTHRVSITWCWHGGCCC